MDGDDRYCLYIAEVQSSTDPSFTECLDHHEAVLSKLENVIPPVWQGLVKKSVVLWYEKLAEAAMKSFQNVSIFFNKEQRKSPSDLDGVMEKETFPHPSWCCLSSIALILEKSVEGLYFCASARNRKLLLECFQLLSLLPHISMLLQFHVLKTARLV